MPRRHGFSSTLGARAEATLHNARTGLPSYARICKRAACAALFRSLTSRGAADLETFDAWAKTGRGTQPYFIRRRDGRPFTFAGLWERWMPTDSEPVESCTILTTSANDVMRPIHERMPVILDPADYATWLGEARAGTDELRALLRPYSAEAMDAYPVSRFVNNPEHDDERCLAPVAVK